MIDTSFFFLFFVVSVGRKMDSEAREAQESELEAIKAIYQVSFTLCLS